MISFFLFVLLSTAAQADPSPAPELYFTAKLTKPCECYSVTFSFADMKPAVKREIFKKGKILGRYCKAAENKVWCEVEQKDEKKGLRLECPTECASIKQTPVLSEPQKKAILEKANRNEHEGFRAKIPEKVRSDFETRFPAWVTPLNRQGQFLDYQPRYEVVASSVLDIPVSYVSPEEKILKNEWVTVVAFYKDQTAAQKETMSWGIWVRSTGKFIREDVLRCHGKKTPPVRTFLSFQFLPTSPVQVVLNCGTADASTAFASPESVLSMVLEGKKGYSPHAEGEENSEGDPLEGAPSWFTSHFHPNEPRSINGPANMRKKPSKTAELVGECRDGTFAVLSGDEKADGWGLVYCDGKEGWTSEKNLRPFPKKN